MMVLSHFRHATDKLLKYNQSFPIKLNQTHFLKIISPAGGKRSISWWAPIKCCPHDLGQWFRRENSAAESNLREAANTNIFFQNYIITSDIICFYRDVWCALMPLEPKQRGNESEDSHSGEPDNIPMYQTNKRYRWKCSRLSPAEQRFLSTSA